ncbi:hypothetical protein CHLRE_14g608652v5 [Chlamydomonas reinhardtii]|uniref:Uncharacterized protein n=1 Tax=Chlamydomonas reinhardtii TaxID=3055 RepID=A0A2K3CX24_CHLRE|nr:uncharacterized protein CHLRE_14g608652v5 [Chlamydomonas reinhardtii]PNW72844.1 hypothetical protein CHLRE_14g608652v5 [Chlamydomonas reinhardtii]
MSRPVGARPPLTEMGEPPCPPWKAHEPHPTTTSSLGLPPVSCLATRWSARSRWMNAAQRFRRKAEKW